MGLDLDALHDLHRQFATDRDTATRDELMAAYDDLARSIAAHFRTRRESPEDLLQVARIALLNAVDRFDPALERPFPVFARATILGELKRHVRDRTWRMRVPRSLQEHYLLVNRSLEILTGELGRSPTVDEIAARAGITGEQVLEATELAWRHQPTSLDQPGPDGGLLLDPGTEDAAFGHVDLEVSLSALVCRLPASDQEILRLRFHEGLSQAEIAERFGVSQMSISRWLVRILGRLRMWARTSAF